MSTLIFNYGFWEFWAPYDPPSEYFGNQKVTFDGENRLIIVNEGVTYLRVKEDIYSNWKEWVQVRENSEWYEALRTTGGDPLGGGLYSGDIYFTINGWKIVINEQVTVEGIIYDNTPGVSPFIVNPGGGVRNTVSNLALQYTTNPGGDCPTVEQIRIEMDTNSVKLADIDTKVTNIDTTVSGMNTTVTGINSTVNLTNATVNTIDATVTSMNSTVNNIDSTVSSIDATVTSMNSTVNNIDTKITNIDTTVNNVDATVTSMNSTVNNIDATVAALPSSAQIAQDVWNYSVRELTSTMTPEQFWNFLLSTPMAPGSAGEKLKQTLTTGNFLALK